MSEQARTTIDQAEVDRFSAMAAEWWDPKGKFRPLHKFNPVRLTYIRDRVCGQFGRDAEGAAPARRACACSISAAAAACCPSRWPRMGANVLGADASEKNISIARTHAEQRRRRRLPRRDGRGAGGRRRELRCRAQHGSGRACRRCAILHRAPAPRWCSPAA